jgi:DNA-binding NarL/FixJ family response regulator
MIKRGLLILPHTSVKGSKVITDMASRISAMKAAGASLREMSNATGLAKDTVSSYICKANKEAGTGYGQAKRSSYKLTPDQQQEIIQLTAAGQTDSAIASKIGVCAKTVSNVLKRHGLERHKEVHV